MKSISIRTILFCGCTFIISFTCFSKTQSPPVPEAVDLGLSVKWASFNLGASKPEESGAYYGWSKKMTSEDQDVTHVLLGDDWRTPTSAEWRELSNENNCTWEFTTINGVNGDKITSKKEGYTDQWIFLPYAGTLWKSRLSDAGSNGYYLIFNSSTPFFVLGGEAHDYDYIVGRGFSIRPVKPRNNAGLTFRVFTKPEIIEYDYNKTFIVQSYVGRQSLTKILKEIGFVISETVKEKRLDYTGTVQYDCVIETYAKTVNGYITTVKIEEDYSEIHFPNLEDVNEFIATAKKAGLKQEGNNLIDPAMCDGTDITITGTTVVISYRWEP